MHLHLWQYFLQHNRDQWFCFLRPIIFHIAIRKEQWSQICGRNFCVFEFAYMSEIGVDLSDHLFILNMYESYLKCYILCNSIAQFHQLTKMDGALVFMAFSEKLLPFCVLWKYSMTNRQTKWNSIGLWFVGLHRFARFHHRAHCITKILAFRFLPLALSMVVLSTESSTSWLSFPQKPGYQMLFANFDKHLPVCLYARHAIAHIAIVHCKLSLHLKVYS